MLGYIVLCLIITTVSKAQWVHYKPENKPIRMQSVSDSSKIKKMLNDLVFFANNGKEERIKEFLSAEMKSKYDFIKKTKEIKKYNAKAINNNYYLEINNIEISFNNNNAQAKFNVFDIYNEINEEETIELTKKADKWIIENSKFMIDYIYVKGHQNQPPRAMKTCHLF